MHGWTYAQRLAHEDNVLATEVIHEVLAQEDVLVREQLLAIDRHR